MKEGHAYEKKMQQKWPFLRLELQGSDKRPWVKAKAKQTEPLAKETLQRENQINGTVSVKREKDIRADLSLIP